MNNEEFAAKVVILLELKTAGEIADDLLVSRTTVLRWSEGKFLPRRGTRATVASYFKKSIKKLKAGGVCCAEHAMKIAASRNKALKEVEELTEIKNCHDMLISELGDAKDGCEKFGCGSK